MNTNKIAKTNSIRIIGVKNKKEHFDKCNNMSFHDLTTNEHPSMHIKTLLGFSPKVFIKPRRLQLSNTMWTMDSVKRVVRLKDYLMSNSFDHDDKIPRSYRKMRDGNHQIL